MNKYRHHAERTGGGEADPGRRGRVSLLRDRRGRERGAVIVLIALALGVCICFSVMAIDIGLILLTRTQLQNAADAAALAGVSALRDFNQVTATERAFAVARQSLAWQDGMEPVVIADNDVTFPSARRCRVTTHRTHSTGDPLRTFFVRVLDTGNDRLADVTAVAEAEYYFICGTEQSGLTRRDAQRTGVATPRREGTPGRGAAARFDAIAARRGVVVSSSRVHAVRATPCSPRLQELLAESVAAVGLPVRRLASGAGHDAMVMAAATEVGMLFVRCGAGGVSHNPAETVSAEDAGLAVAALREFLGRFRPA